VGCRDPSTSRPDAQRQEQAARALALPPHGRADEKGSSARLYAGACADCHDRGRAAEGGALQLPLAIAPVLPTPANLIHIIRDGIVPQPQEHAAWMPSFTGALTDDEIAEVVIYVRSFSGYPPWTDVPGAVRAAKAKADE
jgi:mono/diheme cytochrome c family protein